MTEPPSSHEPLAKRRLLDSKQSCWLRGTNGCWHVFPSASSDHKSRSIPESRLPQRRRPYRLTCLPQSCISDEPRNTLQTSKRRQSRDFTAAGARWTTWFKVTNTWSRPLPWFQPPTKWRIIDIKCSNAFSTPPGIVKCHTVPHDTTAKPIQSGWRKSARRDCFPQSLFSSACWPSRLTRSVGPHQPCRNST